ncbi:MAG: serine protease [Bacteroidetes bacterium HGW-Bacteroidetes-2]|jgi:subtilisin family serine protease|nr:MAG: serine protease [Bacteroidetes bacterium HGW-Bacteroidetes-2]
MKKISLLFALLLTQIISAQIEDAWVFFADKENVQQSINNPITILSQEALDRKAMNNVPIDARDVPVNENYITQIKNQTGITVFAKSKWMNCVYVRGTVANVENLLNLPFVTVLEFADKSMNFSGINTPIDDKFAEPTTSKTIFNYGFAANQIEMLAGDYLHQQGYTGTGMRIAFLDAGYPGVDTQQGFAYVREDGRILGTYDFVDRSETINNNSTHGTKTFSDVGGYIENQFVGTAPDASFYLFKTEDVTSENPVEEAYWVEALERADSLGVHVINTSLGYREYDNPAYSHTYEDLDGQTTFSARGANIGFEKGLLLVTSAGNSGNSGFPWVGTPGDSPGMLTIGAVDADGNYAGFSSIGPTVDGRVKPDVMAQGASSYVISENNQIVTNSGTSFSSPITAGVVACLWQAGLQLSNAQIMQLVKESAHLYNNPTAQMGYGIPNFQTALEALVLAVEDQTQEIVTVYPNPVADYVYFSFPNSISSVEVSLYNVLGNLVKEETLLSSKNFMDISTLRRGIYIATLRFDNKTQALKIIKK